MNVRVADGLRSLTEREKEALRLMARGHDAKSMARTLDLSVHTINERLRGARQKLEVPSSREAARMLLAAEGPSTDPNTFGSVKIGDAEPTSRENRGAASSNDAERATRPSRFTIGVLAMTLILGLLVLAAAPQLASTQTPAATADPVDAAVVDAARQWLALVDEGRWEDSYRATGSSFQKLNTAKVWADVSIKVRTPLGALVSRELLSQENLPAPPHGYEVVKFRTSFANKAQAVETVTLDREGGQWRVVGITIG